MPEQAINKELASAYNEILGITPSADTEQSNEQNTNSDTNIMSPSSNRMYQDGLDEDGVDPRDPTTYKEVSTEDGQEPEDDEFLQEDDDSEDDSDDQTLDEIPAYLVHAARMRGFSDKEIEKLAENDMETLEALAKASNTVNLLTSQIQQFQQQPQYQQPEQPQNQAKQPETKGFDLSDLDYDLDPSLKNKLETAFNSQSEKIQQLENIVRQQSQVFEQMETQRRMQQFNEIESFFDEKAKDFPQLGSSKNATPESQEARRMAVELATAFQKGSGGRYTIQEALDLGISAVKGQLTERTLKSNIAKSLKKEKKKFSARPKSRKGERSTSEQNLTGGEFVAQKMKDLGIT